MCDVRLFYPLIAPLFAIILILIPYSKAVARKAAGECEKELRLDSGGKDYVHRSFVGGLSVHGFIATIISGLLGLIVAFQEWPSSDVWLALIIIVVALIFFFLLSFFWILNREYYKIASFRVGGGRRRVPTYGSTLSGIEIVFNIIVICVIVAARPGDYYVCVP